MRGRVALTRRPAALLGGGLLFLWSFSQGPALDAQNRNANGTTPSFSQRLEQAARAAANPLRALSNVGNQAASSSPRGDDALNGLPPVNRPATNNPNPVASATGTRNHSAGAQNRTGNQNRRTPQKKQKPAPREKLETFVLKANIILGDGRSVRGRVTFRAPEKIVVSHKYDGINYRKTIRIRDLRSMEITQWKGEPQRKNRKGEWIYQFSPRQSTLTLAGNLTLKENARLLPYFEKLTIRNSNGQVTLFSYWIDLLKKDGSWHTGITGPVNGLRRSGHKDVVQRIEFGDQDDHE